jgi:hypothetical protein
LPRRRRAKPSRRSGPDTRGARHFSERAPLLLRGCLVESCLPVQIVDRLAYRVSDPPCGIFHVADHAIGCTFTGHLVVACKITDAFLDCACG